MLQIRKVIDFGLQRLAFGGPRQVMKGMINWLGKVRFG